MNLNFVVQIELVEGKMNDDEQGIVTHILQLMGDDEL